MSTLDEFRSRLDEAAVLLRSSVDIEEQQAHLPLPSPEMARMLSSARAAAYIMIYNAVEFALREFVHALRTDIESEQIQFRLLATYWKRDYLKYLFYDQLSQGIQHGNMLDLIGENVFLLCQWRKDEHKRKLPMGGNVNKRRIFELIKALDITFRAPAGTLGGDDLENIWTRRNALAHGEESFEESGREIVVAATLEVIERVETFVVALMAALEEYRTSKRFLAPTP